MSKPDIGAAAPVDDRDGNTTRLNEAAKGAVTTSETPSASSSASPSPDEPLLDEASVAAALSERSSMRVGNRETLNGRAAVVGALCSPSGVNVGTHKFRLKSYKNTFSGEEVVSWMLVNLPFRTREEACEYGDKLVREGMFEIATTHSQRLKDDQSHLYRFTAAALALVSSSPADSATGATTPVLQNSTPTRDSGGSTSSSTSTRQSTPLAPGPTGGLADSTSGTSYVQEMNPEDFKIVRKLGTGSFGVVYEVTYREGTTPYAMKVLRKSKFTTSQQLEQIMTERNVLLNDHPFLVTLHYSFQTKTHIYLVMDYIGGGDMLSVLKRRGRLNKKEVRFFSAELALALHYLHKNDIVYRDIKPENVLVDPAGHVCLTDFGVCKALTKGARTNSVVGTPSHVAPEVLSKKFEYGVEVDFWSLGVLMYEMITGKTPFADSSIARTFDNIKHKQLVFDPNYFPSEAITLMEGLLDRNQKTRFGFADIVKHPFYKGINWEKLELRQVKSPFKAGEKWDAPQQAEPQQGPIDHHPSDAGGVPGDGQGGTIVSINGLTFVSSLVEEEEEDGVSQ
eukprot:TRINITY_DN7063_c0_g1_i1.p1 TRINITY_DN7063_c0_g1~~TRINITY_DN7063_c0_g1_i1.p1  ORF type:complete len:566 (+),score=115.96 TRINITY_DN7063_c0_g1_i1:319-2016(+)